MSKKICIIDDDVAILEAVSLLLQSEGYDIVSISKPNNIIERIAKEKPKLILLDVLLSGDDGREIANKLKSTEATKDIPIILLSAYSGMEQKYKHSKADDFIAKPFEIEDLLSKVKKYIQ